MRYHKTYRCDECNILFNHWSKYQKHKKFDHDKNGNYGISLIFDLSNMK